MLKYKFSYSDSMIGLLSSVTHETFLYRSHMKSSSVINKLVIASSQCQRVMFRSLEMFADEE